MHRIETVIAGDRPLGDIRLDRVVQEMTGLSRAGVRGLLDHGRVSVNGETVSLPQTQLHHGDQLRIAYDPHRRYKEKPAARSDPAFRLLHEDDHLLVVDKAAHVQTVPTDAGEGNTLIEALERHVSANDNRKRRRARLHVVHRLDRGVSGVLVVAKSPEAAAGLKRQFASHKPQRIYIAIVNGVVQPQKGAFRSRLITDARLNRRSTKKRGEGELAITHYKVISTAYSATLVRVQLETGRRNQIRVHFAEAGHSVLGDRRYARGKSNANMTSSHPKWRAKRIALHAMSLEFEHPATGKTMRFEAELPREFGAFTARAAKPAG